MRRLFLLLLAAAICVPAFAQSGARPRPQGTAPLEEPPEAKAEAKEGEAALEQQVTTRKVGSDTVTEYRIGGKLYMVKVTPAKGQAYVMVDHRGDGTFSRQEGLDTGVRVPQWVLLEF